MAEKWERIPEETDVLITHIPPLGFGDRASGTRESCEELLKAVRRVKPSLHVFGHVHYDLPRAARIASRRCVSK